ncbi:hypothetical protein Bhyg_14930 [Pseudolycoriella hygida]|uniref:Carbohydrate kinase PfkB domain-containing protein n=1 Tax=Pseudolycoriella hygida TaxID=35572 RepID=A0A9Q0RXM1_9DIPT|nr:hypothetical protein Bhyg_14930 [Pseudolycoriella hygida]
MTFFEPTDMRKAHTPFDLPTNLVEQIKFISPNIHELNAIAQCLQYDGEYPVPGVDCDSTDAKLFNDLKNVTKFVNEKIENVIVTLGPMGIMMARRNDATSAIYDKEGRYIPRMRASECEIRLYETMRMKEIVNVSGAGDSFASGFIVAMIQGLPENVSVSVGFEASKCALMSSSPVPIIDHASKANGRPGENIAVGVANNTPHTTITRENTWKVVINTLLRTIPIAAWMI